jgi:hypothetical protein
MLYLLDDSLADAVLNAYQNSILEIIFLYYVARSFCETIKLPQEMPKIAKCLKCLKLRYSIDFIKRKKQGM